MKIGLRLFLTAFVLAAGVAAGLGLGRALEPRAVPAAPEPSAAVVNLQESFAAAAEFAMKSVVHITTQQGVEWHVLQVPENVGSGVVVSAEGHVLTNNHVANPPRVMAGMRPTLQVKFVDGREFPAKVVGADPESDMALLKIDVPRDFPLVPATFADSDKVRVGDWCLAIGSPFGYNHTVTAGIVGAKHRRANLGLPYQDFLQTDAAINPGNSGGALVNLRGELIGINTAIITESRGNDGVGLAISAKLARWVKDQLLEHGRVRRGYLGVRTWNIDEGLVQALGQDGIKSLKDLLDDLGLKEPKGAFIFRSRDSEAVGKGSPAEKAGLKEGDVIVELNGQPVTGLSEMQRLVAEFAPGTAVNLKVLRDGQPREFKVDLAERPAPDPSRRRR